MPNANPPDNDGFGFQYVLTHFSSSRPLAIQQMTHSLYRQNDELLVDHLLRCLQMTGREHVLDLACGNGFILREVANRLRSGGRAVAVDISPAMLAEARQNVNSAWAPVEFIEGQVQRLERFADGTFDLVMANYIFHYIDEPDPFCAEIARLVSPEGRAVVTIEARHSMPEMYETHFTAMEKVGFPSDLVARVPRGRRGKMTLENAEETLAAHFGRIEERPYSDALIFESVEPFMLFYASGHGFCGTKSLAKDSLPPSAFDDLYAEVEALVSRRIADNGSFTVTKLNSVFVCTERS